MCFSWDFVLYALYKSNPIRRKNMKNTLKNSNNKAAFTLAEVLITIGIIGVVAAMTIPTLITNYQRAQNLNRFKKVYSQLSQAIQYASEDYDLYNLGNDWSNQTEIMDALKKYLKVSKTYTTHQGYATPMCYNDGYIKPYGNGSSQYNWQNNKNDAMSGPFNGTMSMELMDGTCIGFGKWNRYIYIDINGSNNMPNIAGRDLFFFYIDSDNKFLPFGYGNSSERIKDPAGLSDSCTDSKGPDTVHRTGGWCAARIIQDNWQITYY
jgi:prepilin-type N-terminal cleavage/methylation domain-containing protein